MARMRYDNWDDLLEESERSLTPAVPQPSVSMPSMSMPSLSMPGTMGVDNGDEEQRFEQQWMGGAMQPPSPKATEPPLRSSTWGGPSKTPSSMEPVPRATATTDYGSDVQRLQAATDPRDRAIATDTLGRRLYSDLVKAGHEVSWQGDQLQVDGRLYDIGGGETMAAGPAGTMMASAAAGGGDWGGDHTPTPEPLPAPVDPFYTPPGPTTPRADEYRRPTATGDSWWNRGKPPEQWTPLPPPMHPSEDLVDTATGQTRRIPGYESPEYSPTSGTTSSASMPSTTGGSTWTGTGPGPYSGVSVPGGYRPEDFAGFDFGRQQDPTKSAKDAFLYFVIEALKSGAPKPMTHDEAAPWFMQHIAPKMAAMGYPVEWADRDSIRVQTREGWDEVDWLINAGGANPQFGWQSKILAGGGAPSPTPTGTTPIDPGGTAIPTPPGGSPEVTPVPIPPYERPTFTPTAPTYTPGEIPMDDIPRQSFEELLAALGGHTYEGLPELGEGATGAAGHLTDEGIINLLRDPYSMDTRDVEILKAASKDELAEMAEADEANLLGAAFDTGNDPEGRWFQSEQAAGRRDRDRALTLSNRNIDMEAAARRGDELRSALGIGATYTDQKAGRARADRDQMFREQAQSQQTRLAQVQLASDVTLQQAALTQDRLALREAVKQKATELGQSADKLMADFTLGVADDLTERYRIDVGAELERMGLDLEKYGIDVGAALDREKLSQAGREFQEDLAFRIMALREDLKYRYAALDQDDQQFGAGYGLDVARLNRDYENDAWNRLLATFGGA